MTKLPTGWRIRRSFCGKLVLQRSERYAVYVGYGDYYHNTRWVDASIQDWLES